LPHPVYICVCVCIYFCAAFWLNNQYMYIYYQLSLVAFSERKLF